MIADLVCGANVLKYSIVEYTHPWQPHAAPRWQASVTWHTPGVFGGTHWKEQSLGVFATHEAAVAAALDHRENYTEPALERDVLQGHRHFEE